LPSREAAVFSMRVPRSGSGAARRARARRNTSGAVTSTRWWLASREAKFAAAEAYFEKYGVPPLDDEATRRIEAEWRGEATPKKARRRAA
jgi:hypothetical protein